MIETLMKTRVDQKAALAPAVALGATKIAMEVAMIQALVAAMTHLQVIKKVKRKARKRKETTRTMLSRRPP